MSKLFLILCFLFFAQNKVFGFSETEIDSLESSGTKNFSESPWRTELGFSLKRNLHVETKFRSKPSRIKPDQKKSSQLCDPSKEGSLCDLSNLYYGLDFTLYHSLGKIAGKSSSYKFLKNTELFLSGSFTSHFKGGPCAELADYNFSNYIKCSLGNIAGGLTSPLYKKRNLFAFLNLSGVLFPLSKRSKDAGHITSIDSSVSSLYFLKKHKDWSMALSSNHSLAYNHFKKQMANNNSYNTPFDTSQGLSLIYKQNFNKYLPSNSALSSNYSLGINTYKTDKKNCDSQLNILACGTRSHYLSLGARSSWKLKQRLYLQLSASWQDLIHSHNPQCTEEDPRACGKKTQKASLSLNKWYFNLRASYSF